MHHLCAMLGFKTTPQVFDHPAAKPNWEQSIEWVYRRYVAPCSQAPKWDGDEV